MEEKESRELKHKPTLFNSQQGIWNGHKEVNCKFNLPQKTGKPEQYLYNSVLYGCLHTAHKMQPKVLQVLQRLTKIDGNPF